MGTSHMPTRGLIEHESTVATHSRGINIWMVGESGMVGL